MPDWAVGRIGKNTNRWAHIRHIAVTKKQQLLSKKSIKTHLQDYCENTTIHGFKYIGEKGRPMIERIWWTLVLGLAMAGSTYLISKVWYKWHDSPVFISFSATLTPVWQIPFPTVTICSETKVRQSVFNFTHATHSTNLTEDENKMRDDISLVCDSHLTTNGSKFTDESTIDIIKKLAPQFEEMIWKCTWKTYTVHCSDLFIPVITEEGLCFSFNSLLPMEMYRDTVVQSQEDLKYNTIIKSDWNLEKGYDVSAPLETKPRRAIGTGFQAGISVILRSYKYDLGYLCHGPVHGFKVLLHNPAEIPRMSERYFRVPHDQELLVPVQPDIITTSEDLRSYHPSSRQCYFPSERHLTYFKVYTQRNCEVECLTKYTLKKCQCAAIYMPRLESTSLCGAGSKQCMSDANDELKMEEIMLKMQKTETLGNTCDCLPACTSLQYEAETSQAHFKWLKLFNSYEDNMSMFDEVQLSRVSIYFKDERFITSIRNELYGVADFLAICGGLLGLFSGISVLSLIEIVYYITLRFYTNVRHQKESTEGDTASHPDVFKIDPNEKTNYDRIIVTSYRS